MKKMNTRVAAVAGASAAVVVGLSGLGAGGAVAGPLPNVTTTKTLVDGTPVTISITDQFINVQRAVTNVQTSREVWASGKVRVNVGGKADGGSIAAGYQIGCQVNFGAGAGAGVTSATGTDGTTSATGTTSGNITLGPGQATTYWIINTTSGSNTAYDNYNVNDYTFKGRTGGVSYSQEKFGVDGCAGYAEGRPFVQVTVSTDTVKARVVAAGAKFSLG